MNHVLWSLGDHENNYLTTFFADSTKYDIVVILVFFSELFHEYPIRGSARKVFSRFLVGTACTSDGFQILNKSQLKSAQLKLPKKPESWQLEVEM